MFEAYTSGLQKKLVARKSFKPFPVYKDRKEWKDLDPAFSQFLIRRGEEYLGYGWPTTLASVYMDFYRNGNRTRYEDIIFSQRRLPLQYLVAAECCEGEGRFIDDIINGVWATLDEATWVIPAHNSQFSVKKDLPRPLPDTEDPDNVYIDLFAAECGAVIAWVYYIMGDRLGEEAPQIPARMLGELNRRIFKPFLLHDAFGWMGLHGQTVNNWNPWIISNIMTTAAFASQDEEQRAAIMEKCLLCLENFVKVYAPDGGCDEGPGYWNAAGASMFDCLDVLYDVTNGKVDFMKDDLVRNMCAYIYKMHISGKYFVNYADAHATIYPDASVIYLMGKRTGDKNLVKMGVHAYNVQKDMGLVWDLNGCGCQMYRRMKKIFADKQIAKENDSGYPYVKDVWFPGIQVMAARMEEGSDKGLYLSAKGGNNGESHNHNDIGSFVIYTDGKPAIIDIGTGVYEKKTFSAQRYEIPQMQSNYHNLPMISGVGQLPGTDFAAEKVDYHCEKNLATFTLNLKGAYPESAGINSWQRFFTYDRKAGTVTVADDFDLVAPQNIEFVLMTPVRPTFTNDKMTVTVDGTQTVAEFDPAMTPEVEVFDTHGDKNLMETWGERAYRTIFRLPDAVTEGGYKFVFYKK